ncbi:hypothetical protein CW662_00210 [Macrococcoides caseolyticum]|uniref:hypothetical protein n=1 Tax=Macrococcoides caseolyticum TaxID=69966 RepID=UPI000C328836|nr:hypothetical protein [Macrococcus caseolyticus]PKE70960.1 hypothetical protein CW662_00210 [Macrococcus caseolyticus]
MIKVGDYIKHKDNGMIYKVVGSSEKLLHITDFKQTWQHVGVDVATNNYIVVDYKQLYEQQKQRADELEKRWKKLKEHFIKEKEQSFGILSWSRNNGVLELIERLEENNNA